MTDVFVYTRRDGTRGALRISAITDMGWDAKEEVLTAWVGTSCDCQMLYGDDAKRLWQKFTNSARRPKPQAAPADEPPDTWVFGG